MTHKGDSATQNKRSGWLAISRQHPWRIFLGGVLFALVLIIFVLPLLVRWGLEKWIESHGRLQVRIENVDFNLFTGSLVVNSLVAESQGEGELQWLRASLDIAWRPILRRRILLDDIRLRDAVISVVEEEDGALYVGGLRVRRPREAPPRKRPDEESGWEVGFGDIDLHSVRVLFRTPLIIQEALIREAHVDPLQSWNPQSSGGFSMLVGMGEGSLDIQGSARLYGSNRHVIGRLRAADLPLAWINPLFASVEGLTAGVGADAAFAVTWDQALQAAWQGRLALEGLSGVLPQARLEPLRLVWDGSAVLTAKEDQAPEITARGELSADGLEVRVAESELTLMVHNLALSGEFNPRGAAQDGFGLDVSGQARGIRLVQGDDVALAAEELISGGLKIAGHEERVEIRGPLMVDGLAGASPQVTLAPMAVTWEGFLQVAPHPDRVAQITAQGDLSADGAEVRLTEAGLTLAAGRLALKGDFSRTGNTAEGFVFDGDGQARGIRLVQGDDVALAAEELVSDGLQIAGHEERIEIRGPLMVDGLAGTLPQVTLAPMAVNWEGFLQVISRPDRAAQITAQGDFSADGAEVRFREAGLTLAAGRLALKGDFSRAGNAAEGFVFEGDGQARGLHLVRSGASALDLMADKMDLGPLQIVGREDRIHLHGQVALSRLSAELPQAHFRPSAVHWKGEVEITQSPDRKSDIRASGDLSADTFDVIFPRNELAMGLGRLTLIGEFSRPGAAAGFQYRGSGRVEEWNLSRPEHAQMLAAAEQMIFEDARLTSRLLELTATRVDDVRILERKRQELAAENPFMLSADGLDLANIRIKTEQRHVHVDTLKLFRADAVVVRDQSGALDLLPPSGGAAPAAASPGDQGWTFSIDQASLDEASRLRFRDNSLSPAVDLQLNALQINAENLNSAEPGQDGRIRVESEVGQYASFHFEGTISPFGDGFGMDLRGEVKQFSLPKVRAYLARHLGYTARSGQLYSDFHLKATRGTLDSLIKLHIVNLDLVRLTPEEQDEFTRELGMPLNAALDLLRDRDGNVSLDLPVTGELARPDVSYSEVVGQAVQSATFKALRTAALSYFAPLGAAYVATRLLGRLVALRLDPLIFRPGQVGLDERQREYLDQVVEKLEQRPQVTLILCGRATPSDRDYLRPILPEGTPAGAEDPSDARAESILLDMAERRSEAVRTYLISKGIEAGRLTYCTPEIARADDARPQVELAI
jgi:hypothetical protein